MTRTRFRLFSAVVLFLGFGPSPLLPGAAQAVCTAYSNVDGTYELAFVYDYPSTSSPPWNEVWTERFAGFPGQTHPVHAGYMVQWSHAGVGDWAIMADLDGPGGGNPGTLVSANSGCTPTNWHNINDVSCFAGYNVKALGIGLEIDPPNYCNVVIDIAAIPQHPPGPWFLDVYLWDDVNGTPGSVLCVTFGLVLEGVIPFFPNYRTVTLPLGACGPTQVSEQSWGRIKSLYR